MNRLLSITGWLAAGLFIVTETFDKMIYIYNFHFGWGDCVIVGGCGSTIPEIFFSILGVAGFVYLVQNQPHLTHRGPENDTIGDTN